MLIHNIDDIQFVTEFPCLLGHPAWHVCEQCRTNPSERNLVSDELEIYGGGGFQNYFLKKISNKLQFQNSREFPYSRECSA